MENYATFFYTLQKGREICELYTKEDILEYATLLEQCLQYALPAAKQTLEASRHHVPVPDQVPVWELKEDPAHEPAAAAAPEQAKTRKSNRAAAESRRRRRE